MGAIEKTTIGAGVLGVIVGAFWGIKLVGFWGLPAGVAIGLLAAISTVLPFVALHGCFRILAIWSDRDLKTNRLSKTLHAFADCTAVLMYVCAPLGAAIAADWMCHKFLN